MRYNESMRKTWIFAGLLGLTLAAVGLGLKQPAPGFAAELNGFDINTQDKNVTVTLYTDARVPYTTETQGRQFAIILPETELSQAQMNSGLPVVIDNKNRFIGRAMPTGDGKVKIILPNLPASEYTVSVQQKRPSELVATAKTVTTRPMVASRPSLSQPAAQASKADEPFIQLAAKLATPEPSIAISAVTQADADFPDSKPVSKAPQTGKIRLSPANGGSGVMVNPFVKSSDTTPRASESRYSHYLPVLKPKPSSPSQPATAAKSDESVNVLSVADTMARESATAQTATSSAVANGGRANVAAGAPHDPLWFLHSLPPANDSQLSSDNLAGLAKAIPISEISLPEAQTDVAPVAPSQPQGEGLLQELKASARHLPSWLPIVLALFFGGIGAFTLIGALVLLRVLFVQGKPAVQPTFIVPEGMSFVALDANGQPLQKNAPLDAARHSLSEAKSVYAREPEKPAFKDTALVNAMDYLKSGARDVPQAVHNARLIKFPARRRQGQTATRRASVF